MGTGQHLPPAGAVLWDGLTGYVTGDASSSIPITASPQDRLADLISTSSPLAMPIFTGTIGDQPLFASIAPTTGPPSFSSHSSVHSSPAMHSVAGSTPVDFMPPPPSTASMSKLSPSGDSLSFDHKRKRDRERNTEAARRYRKRRVDETEDLRAQLAAMTKERDELKLKLVRAEAEASLLRKLHVAPSARPSP